MADIREAMTPERIAVLRETLRSGQRGEKLDAMEEAASANGEAAALVPDIAALMTSDEYVPCYAREYEFSGHAPLAWHAAATIRQIGVAPDVETVRRLLGDPQLIEVPEACYDQGAYIGDYSTETLSPAGLAASLAVLMVWKHSTCSTRWWPIATMTSR